MLENDGYIVELHGYRGLYTKMCVCVCGIGNGFVYYNLHDKILSY